MIDSLIPYSTNIPSKITKTFMNRLRDQIRGLRNSYRFRQRQSTVPQIDPNGTNVLLIVVDCLRADHTSMAGYSRETTPFLDSFSWRFPNTISAAPWTFPAVPSILTGQYPHNHGGTFQNEFHDWMGGNPPSNLQTDTYILPELLAKAGYDIFASTAVNTAFVPIRGRMPTGTAKGHTNAAEIVSECVSWWKSRKTKKFAYLHFGDLHGLKTDPRLAYDPEEYPFGSFDESVLERFDEVPDSVYNSQFKGIYDTQLHYIDRQLRDLCKSIEDSGEADDTVIIITGDHGEAMGEHTELIQSWFEYPRQQTGYGHGFDLFDESIRVPTFIKNSIKTGKESRLISTTDIVPTILDYLDADYPTIVDGQSLLKEFNSDRVVLSEEVAYGYQQTAVLRNDKKLVFSPENNIKVLLGMVPDGEKLLINGTQAVQHHINELSEFLPDNNSSGKNLNIDATVEDRLADLGYL